MRELPEVFRLIAQDFDSGENVDFSPTLDDLRRFVRGHVERLLDRNPGILMSILYRIDVAEVRVRQVLTAAPHEEIPARLADLIIERQLEKIRLRRTYSKD